MKRTANMIYVPSDEATELVVYAEGERDIYFGRIKPVIENLSKKMKKAYMIPTKLLTFGTMLLRMPQRSTIRNLVICLL